MAIFSVSYDLYLPSEYKEFYDAIEGYPHTHVMDSCWLIEAQGNAQTIRDWLVEYIDDRDSLFVTRLSRDWAGARTHCGQWLNEEERDYD